MALTELFELFSDAGVDLGQSATYIIQLSLLLYMCKMLKKIYKLLKKEDKTKKSSKKK